MQILTRVVISGKDLNNSIPSFSEIFQVAIYCNHFLQKIYFQRTSYNNRIRNVLTFFPEIFSQCESRPVVGALNTLYWIWQ